MLYDTTPRYFNCICPLDPLTIIR